MLRYDTPDGVRMRVEQPVDVTAFRAVRQGATVPLTYLVADPARMQLGAGGLGMRALWLQWAALVFGLASLTALWAIGGRAARGVQARRYGRRGEARVLGVARAAGAVSGQRGYRLLWRDGQGREGRSLVHERRDVALYRAGDVIDVYTTRAGSWWLGDVGARHRAAD